MPRLRPILLNGATQSIRVARVHEVCVTVDQQRRNEIQLFQRLLVVEVRDTLVSVEAER